MRWLGFALVLGSCESASDGPCDLIEGFDCPECLDGIYTCSYADVSFTGPGCMACQTRFAVYESLCQRGSEDSAEMIEAGTECVLDEAL